MDHKLLENILITDCGSTTTKSLLFVRDGSKYVLKARGEAPTTVEPPFLDVNVGVRNSINQIRRSMGEEPLSQSGNKLSLPNTTFLATSSAGGGLQMIVAGVSKKASGRAGLAASLGAGAIVLDTFFYDNNGKALDIVEMSEHLRISRPDIILVVGGTDGGAKRLVIELLEIIKKASPPSRFNALQKTPVLYCGNKHLHNEVTALLPDIHIGDNVMPSFGETAAKDCRDRIHDLFLGHVMEQSPGYHELLASVDVPIVPTPMAASQMVESLSRRTRKRVLAIDIGGATTDIFSTKIEDEKFHFYRTVSANLGMSYSIGNVVKEAGLENIKKWLLIESLPANDNVIKDELRNKMLRPTSIPVSDFEIEIEHAVAREAIRLALEHHEELTKNQNSKRKTVGSFFSDTKETYRDYAMIIGSGGVLSHVPTPNQAIKIILDAIRPVGHATLFLDKSFMMPHLGMLSVLDTEISEQLFLEVCLQRLAEVFRFELEGSRRPPRVLARLKLADNSTKNIIVGDYLNLEVTGKIIFIPHKRVNCGRGPGQRVEIVVEGPTLTIDARL